MNTESEQQTPSQIRTMFLELNRNESRILFERLKGMLTFQGLLFASVGISASKDLYLLAILVSAVGGLACIPWRIAVQVSYRGMKKIGNELAALNKKLEEHSRLPPIDVVNVTPWEFRLLPEVVLPVVVGVIWFLVIFYLIVRSICR